VVLGLKAGNYDVKVVGKTSGVSAEVTSIAVSSYDRSGYAHFGTGYSGGVGAYNDDGTLKDNAIVVYVNDENKNTVTAKLGGKTYTGLVAILQADSKSTYPLDVRISGKIVTNQFASSAISGLPYDNPSYYQNSLETTYATNLKGLKSAAWGPSAASSYWDLTTSAASSSGYSFSFSKVSSTKDTDSYFNMCDVSGANNVTVEGVSSDAALEQWGFTWKTSNSIEVRNLLFENYVEDACSFQGGSNSNMDFHNFWLHNCRFNRGLNHWDLTYEKDKSDGDGGFDIKYLHNITSSENIFYNCHKTGLIGGSDSAYTMNVTYHHNLYSKCSSRLPLGREANMHFYNNYYLNCTTCQDIRANAYCFSEANYFSGCKNPQLVTNDSTYSGTAIKSFGDVLTGCGTSKATVVTDRSKEISNSCKPDGSTNYSSFTTDSSLFYYDSANKKSDVSLYLSAADVPAYVEANAGLMW
jgi:pectate lyase